MQSSRAARLFLEWLHRAGQAAEHRLMPESCAFCGTELGAGTRPVCDGCHAELPWIDPACRRCGLPLPGGQPGADVCGRCQLRTPPFVTVVAPLRYEFPIDAAIKAFKFRRKLHYAPAFAYLLREHAHRLPPDIDGLVPVPLHWRRRMRRGFNQAGELCAALGGPLSLPVVQCARRVRNTLPQSGLDAGRRRANLRGAFRLCGGVVPAHPLIVDDVVTTGTTCELLAAALRDAGAGAVSVLAIARALRPD